MKYDPVYDAALAAPPAATSAVTLLGIAVADWVLWLNLFYVSALIIHWTIKRVQEWRQGRKGEKSDCT